MIKIYDIMKFEDEKTKKYDSLITFNSYFKVDISLSEIIIFMDPDSKDYNFLRYDPYSWKAKACEFDSNGLRGYVLNWGWATLNNLFVRIEDCPKYIEEDLRKLNKNGITEEKRKRKKTKMLVKKPNKV